MTDSTEVIMEETMAQLTDSAATIDCATMPAKCGNDPLSMCLAMLGPFLYALLAFGAIVLILSIVCNWIIFEKAGRKGWESLIPIYSAYVFFQIIGRSFWNILWAFFPFVGWIVLTIRVCGGLAKVFGRSVGFAWGLAFFPAIFMAIIAFDKSIVYVGPNGANASANNEE